MSPRGAVLRQLPTAELTAAELVGAARAASRPPWPDGGFTDDDFAHGMGGMHWVAEVDGSIVSHASVVPRRLEAGDRLLRTGYLEAVGDAARVRAARLRVDGGSRGGAVSASAVRARGAVDGRPRVLPPPRLGGLARADVRPRRGRPRANGGRRRVDLRPAHAVDAAVVPDRPARLRLAHRATSGSVRRARRSGRGRQTPKRLTATWRRLSAVASGGKNGVPAPMATGWTTRRYSSTRPRSMNCQAMFGPLTSISPSSSSRSFASTSPTSPWTSRQP